MEVKSQLHNSATLSPQNKSKTLTGQGTGGLWMWFWHSGGQKNLFTSHDSNITHPNPTHLFSWLRYTDQPPFNFLNLRTPLLSVKFIWSHHLSVKLPPFQTVTDCQQLVLWTSYMGNARFSYCQIILTKVHSILQFLKENCKLATTLLIYYT